MAWRIGCLSAKLLLYRRARFNIRPVAEQMAVNFTSPMTLIFLYALPTPPTALNNRPALDARSHRPSLSLMNGMFCHTQSTPLRLPTAGLIAPVVLVTDVVVHV